MVGSRWRRITHRKEGTVKRTENESEGSRCIERRQDQLGPDEKIGQWRPMVAGKFVRKVFIGDGSDKDPSMLKSVFSSTDGEVSETEFRTLSF